MPTTLPKPPKKQLPAFEPDFRFNVAQYQKMISEGIFAADTQVELLEGKVVNKMARNPPHDATLYIVQEELRKICSSDWLIRCQLGIVIGKLSQPEPDLSVVRAPIGRYLKQHPGPKDTGMLVEVAESSLELDRHTKGPIYAGARIPWYWIVNLQELIVEVYSEPRAGESPRYRKRTEYALGDNVPVVLNGKHLGHVKVCTLFPDEAA